MASSLILIFPSDFKSFQESTSKPIPIMLCGNKTDLRQSYIAEGKNVITEENGEKLARVSYRNWGLYRVWVTKLYR